MIYLGKTQKLQIVKMEPHGFYLASLVPPPTKLQIREDGSILSEDRILLPKNSVPDGSKDATHPLGASPPLLNDLIEVFVYKDSKDRPIATTATPLLTLGEVAELRVSAITDIGIFLDMGLPKELLLPYAEQTYEPSIGDPVLVALYIDKSRRLCATMKVYNYLSTDSPYSVDDKVSGRVYEIIDNFGAFVAVDSKYSALIPRQSLYANTAHVSHGNTNASHGNTNASHGNAHASHDNAHASRGVIKCGDIVEARVTFVHEDGKINLDLREKRHIQMDSDSAIVLDMLRSAEGGFLPYHDKSNPDDIKEVFHISKAAFKRATGRLMKDGSIMISEDGIKLLLPHKKHDEN